MDVREVVGFLFVLLSGAGFLGYVVHFVWASFHTGPGTSQARSLLTSWTVLQPDRYTERGRQILRRMWLCVGVALLSMIGFALTARA